VAGGGFTGIETATEMPGRLRAILGTAADIRVVIVERGELIAAQTGDQPAPCDREGDSRRRRGNDPRRGRHGRWTRAA
jgi:NADH dehydrogenase